MKFESKLSASREQIWNWITSIDGISTELSPYFRMTAPKHIRNLSDLKLSPGAPLFRSYILFFGFLPIDYSDLTLLKLKKNESFTEVSPMGSMKNWRHERHIQNCASDSSKILLIDQLTFEPRFASSLVVWMIRKIFEHRHKVLRENFATTNGFT